MRRAGPTTLAVGIVACVTLIAVSCGGNKKSDDASKGGGGSSSQGKTLPNGDSDAKPKTGGTLTFALEAETSGGWCIPEAQLAAGGIEVANAVYDPLMALGADFKPHPYLAQSLEVNDTATLFTFELRSGVKFHDGTPLTAKVVKLNIDLWKGDAAAKAATGRTPLLLPLAMTDVGDITVLDDLTFTIATKRPWPAFPGYLTGGRSGIAAEAQLKSSAEDCRAKPIGTGPFRFVKWDRNVEVDLERNPDYWMKDRNGVQLPYLDKLVFKPIPDPTDRMSALEAGAVDALHTTTKTNLDRAAQDPKSFNVVTDTDGHREVSYGLINVTKPPFDDLAMRVAFAQAVDRERLNKVANDGTFRIANGPFDTAVMGYLPDLRGPKYDPEAARKAFAGKNLTVDYTYTAGPYAKKVAEEIQRQMDQVGAKVELSALDQASVVNKALGGDFNVLWWRNHPGGDPDGLYGWFYSSSSVNLSRIKDPDLDKLFDDGRVETDEAKRTAIYQEINQRMSEQAYELWAWYAPWWYLTRSEVKNSSGYLLPDSNGVASEKGAGMNWGWSFLPGVWKDS